MTVSIKSKFRLREGSDLRAQSRVTESPAPAAQPHAVLHQDRDRDLQANFVSIFKFTLQDLQLARSFRHSVCRPLMPVGPTVTAGHWHPVAKVAPNGLDQIEL